MQINEMTIEEIIEKELNQIQLPEKPDIEEKTGNQLLVAGLPIVPSTKIKKLKEVVKSKMKCEDIQVPMDCNDQSKGFIFVRYASDDIAVSAHQCFNGAAFDKKHTFNTMLLKDYNKLMKEDSEWKEPEPLVWRYRNDMLTWLLQRQCRDQLLVHSKSDINIYEHSQKNLEQKWSKSEFNDSMVLWSPLGTFMATIHSKGVALWGGEQFVQINRFHHTGIRNVLFSPNEKYIMTFSTCSSSYFVNVFDVLTGLLIREFVIQKCDEDKNQSWPEFRWSYDDLYFARKQKDKISVYQSDNCVLVDKKSIDIVNIKDFTWSSRSHLISYWVGEQETTPARIVLISLPSKKEIFTKTLFNVVDISFKWSSQDDYLAVVGERYIKKKIVDKQIKYTGVRASLDIYLMKENEIPVETIVIGDKIQIFANDWEVNGSKLAILTFQEKTNVTSIQIYDLKVLEPAQKKIFDYQFSSRMSILKWSPSGQIIACSAPNGSCIEFIDSQDKSVLRQVETQTLNNIVWDPTGRFLLSYRLSLLDNTTECSVSFHTITGRLLMEKSFFGLKQIMWRPRPPCLLSEQEIKEIKKNTHKYNKQFAHQDEMMSNETKRKLLEYRQKLMQEWLSTKSKIHQIYQSEKSIRMKLRNNEDTDNLENGKCNEQIYVLVS